MQRVLEQARAEAAAQSQGASQPAPAGNAASTDAAKAQADMSQPEQEPTAGNDKKALGALLRKAAQKMQQDEQGQSDSATALAEAPLQRSVTIQQDSAARISGDQPDDAGDDLLDSAAVNLTGLSEEGFCQRRIFKQIK